MNCPVFDATQPLVNGGRNGLYAKSGKFISKFFDRLDRACAASPLGFFLQRIVLLWIAISSFPLLMTQTVLAQTPPSITTQPQSQIVAAGSNVTFSVSVSGAGPFSYQWQFNGT